MAMGSLGLISIVHLVLLLLLIIELGLTGYIVNVDNGGYSAYNFQLFNSIWSILALIYLGLIPIIFETLFHGLVALIILGISTLFWFAGSTAVAAYIGVPDCHENFCRSVQASVAFGFFIWAIFTLLTVMDVTGYMKAGGASSNVSSKPGRPYPGV